MPTTILADDLTGACDTGCLFAGRGAVGVIAEPTLRDRGADVVAVDTESRACSALEAARRVRDAATRHAARLAAGPTFKKIDSTMRGPVGAELEALLAAGVWKGALVCPAFPAQGRIVRDGALWVHGEPAHRSPVGRDRHYPGATSEMMDMLEPAMGGALARLPLDAVRGGIARVRERLACAAGAAIVADAETDADLDVLAAALASLPTLLGVGSAGLGRALADALGFPRSPVALPPPGAWLWIVGSRHPASRAQLGALADAGVAGARLGHDGRGDMAGVLRALGRGAPAYLTAALEPEGDARAIAAALGAAAAAVLAEARPDVLAVTGGATAFGVLGALGAQRLDLIGAPGEGLALGTLASGPASPAGHHPLPLLTKAGGFGDPHLFLRLLGGSSA